MSLPISIIASKPEESKKLPVGYTRNLSERNGHLKPVNSVVYHGGLLFTGADDSNVKVWNAQTSDLIQNLDVFSAGCRWLRVDGSVVYACTNDHAVRAWRFAGKSRKSVGSAVSPRTTGGRSRSPDRSPCATRSPSSESVSDAGGSGSGSGATKDGPDTSPPTPRTSLSRKSSISGASAASKRELLASAKEKLAAPKSPSALDFSVLSAGVTEEAQVFLNSCLSNDTILSHTTKTNCFFISGGNTLIAGCEDGALRLWNLEKKEKEGLMHTLTDGHTRSIECIEVIDEDTFVTGSRDKDVRVWNLKARKCIQTWRKHSEGVLCLAVRGDIVASGSADQSILLWSLKSGQCVQTLAQHTSRVKCLTFREDMLISSSGDASVKLWDLQSGVCIGTITPKGSGPINSFALSADTLFMGCDDRSVKAVDMNTFSAERGLTTEEARAMREHHKEILAKVQEAARQSIESLEAEIFRLKTEGNDGPLEKELKAKFASAQDQIDTAQQHLANLTMSLRTKESMAARLTEQKEELERTIQTLESKIKHLQESNEFLQAESESNQSELIHEKSLKSSLENKLSSAENRNSSLEDEIRTLKSELQSSNQKIEKLESELESASRNCADAQSAKASVEKEALSWKDIATMVQNQNEECENQIGSLRELLDKSERERVAVENLLKQTTEMKEKAAQEAEAQHSRAMTFEQQLRTFYSTEKGMREALESSKKEREILSEKVAFMESTNESLQSSLEESNKKRESLQKEYADKVSALQYDLFLLKEEKSKLEIGSTELHTLNKDAVQLVQQLGEKLEHCERVNASDRKLLQSKQEELRELESANQSLERKVILLEDQLAQESQSLSAARDEIERSQTELGLSEKDRSQTNAQLLRLKSELSDARVSVDQLTRTREKLEGECASLREKRERDVEMLKRERSDELTRIERQHKEAIEALERARQEEQTTASNLRSLLTEKEFSFSHIQKELISLRQDQSAKTRELDRCHFLIGEKDSEISRLKDIMENKMQQHANEKTSLLSKITEHSSTTTKLSDSFQQSLDDLRAEVKSKSEFILSLESTIDSARSNLRQKEDEILELQESFKIKEDASKREVKGKDERIAALQQCVEDLRNQLMAQEQTALDYSTNLSAAESQILSLQSSLEEYERQKQDLVKDMSNLQTKISEREQDFENLQEKLEMTRTEMQSKEEEIHKLTEDAELTKWEINNLDDQKRELLSQASRLQIQVESLRMDKRDLEDRLESAKQEHLTLLHAAQDNACAFETECRALRLDNSDLKREISDLRRNERELESVIENLRGNAEEAKMHEAETTQKVMDDLKSRLSELKSTRDSLAEESERFSKAAEDLGKEREKNAKLQSEIEILQKRLQDSDEEFSQKVRNLELKILDLQEQSVSACEEHARREESLQEDLLNERLRISHILKEKEEQRGLLERSILDLEKELESVSMETISSRESKQEYESKISKLQTELDRAVQGQKQTVESFSKVLQESEARVLALERELSATRMQIFDLESELDRSETIHQQSISSLQRELAAAQTELAKCGDALSQVSEQLKLEKSKSVENMAFSFSFENERKRLETQNHELTCELESVRDELRELKLTLEELNSNSPSGAVDTSLPLGLEIHHLRLQISTLTDQCEISSRKNKVLESQNSSLEKDVSEMCKKLQEVSDQYESEVMRYRILAENMERVSESLRSLESEFMKERTKCVEAVKAAEEAQRAHEFVKGLADKLALEKAELSTRVELMSRELAALYQELSSREESVQILETQIQKILDNKNSEISDLHQKYEAEFSKIQEHYNLSMNEKDATISDLNAQIDMLNQHLLHLDSCKNDLESRVLEERDKKSDVGKKLKDVEALSSKMARERDSAVKSIMAVIAILSRRESLGQEFTGAAANAAQSTATTLSGLGIGTSLVLPTGQDLASLLDRITAEAETSVSIMGKLKTARDAFMANENALKQQCESNRKIAEFHKKAAEMAKLKCTECEERARQDKDALRHAEQTIKEKQAHIETLEAKLQTSVENHTDVLQLQAELAKWKEHAQSLNSHFDAQQLLSDSGNKSERLGSLLSKAVPLSEILELLRDPTAVGLDEIIASACDLFSNELTQWGLTLSDVIEMIQAKGRPEVNVRSLGDDHLQATSLLLFELFLQTVQACTSSIHPGYFFPPPILPPMQMKGQLQQQQQPAAWYSHPYCMSPSVPMLTLAHQRIAPKVSLSQASPRTVITPASSTRSDHSDVAAAHSGVGIGVGVKAEASFRSSLKLQSVSVQGTPRPSLAAAAMDHTNSAFHLTSTPRSFTLSSSGQHSHNDSAPASPSLGTATSTTLPPSKQNSEFSSSPPLSPTQLPNLPSPQLSAARSPVTDSRAELPHGIISTPRAQATPAATPRNILAPTAPQQPSSATLTPRSISSLLRPTTPRTVSSRSQSIQEPDAPSRLSRSSKQEGPVYVGEMRASFGVDG